MTGDTVVTFRETNAASTPAVQYWYYPGEKIGKEFIYPKDQAQRIAARTGATVKTEDGPVTALLCDRNPGSCCRRVPHRSRHLNRAPRERTPRRPRRKQRAAGRTRRLRLAIAAMSGSNRPSRRMSPLTGPNCQTRPARFRSLV